METRHPFSRSGPPLNIAPGTLIQGSIICLDNDSDPDRPPIFQRKIFPLHLSFPSVLTTAVRFTTAILVAAQSEMKHGFDDARHQERTPQVSTLKQHPGGAYRILTIWGNFPIPHYNLTSKIACGKVHGRQSCPASMLLTEPPSDPFYFCLSARLSLLRMVIYFPRLWMPDIFTLSDLPT